MAIRRKVSWVSQPQYPARVDTSNPLTKELKGVFSPLGTGVMYNALPGVLPTSDNGTFKPGSTGIARDYVSGQKSTFANRADYGLAGPLTIAVFTYVDALSNYGALVSCQDSSTTNGWELRLGEGATDSHLLLHRANAGGFRQHVASAGNVLSAGSQLHFIGVTTTSADIESVPTYNINGVSYTAGAPIGGSGTGNMVASTSTLDIGARAAGTTQLDGAVLLVLLWNRTLSYAELEKIRFNPWQVFQPITRNIYAPSAAGGDSVTGNPITWQWETNSVSVKEEVNTTPVNWEWANTLGSVKEKVVTSPISWEWAVTTGSLVGGGAIVLTTNPIDWEWQQGSASFVTKLTGNPISWDWGVTTGRLVEKLNTNPGSWEWETTTGTLLGQTAVTGNPISWEWEVTTGLLVQRTPEVGSGTIGGKPNKQVNWPFYDKGKDYESRIDLEETQPRNRREDVDADRLRTEVKPDRSKHPDINLVSADSNNIKPVNEGDRLVSDLLQELNGQTKPSQIIALPEVINEEYDDSMVESLVVSLLLAA